MSVAVTYNGYVIKPISSMSMTKDYNTQQDGQKLGATFTITLRGVILPFKGSPDEDGDFSTDPLTEPTETAIVDRVDTFKKLHIKQQAIRDLRGKLKWEGDLNEMRGA